MPLYSAEALVLRTYKLGEADRIVVFLTRDRGKKRGVAKGARRSRSRFAAALEPLSRVHLAYFEREQRELVSLNYAELLRSPFRAVDPEALAYVSYFAELIDEWAPDAHADERLFRLGAAVVEALEQPVPVDRVARYFEYWLLRLQGVYPGVTVCPRCLAGLADRGAWLVRAEHALLCDRCTASPEPPDLSPGALAFLRAAAGLPPERLGEAPLAVRASRELEAVHRSLIALHLEREPRSGRVLREMGGVGDGRPAGG